MEPVPEMEEAFVLIRTKPGHIFKVAREAKKHKGVKYGYAVAGLYDVALFISTECPRGRVRENTFNPRNRKDRNISCARSRIFEVNIKKCFHNLIFYKFLSLFRNTSN